MNRMALVVTVVVAAAGWAAWRGCNGSSGEGASPSNSAGGGQESAASAARVVAAKPLRKTLRRVTTEPGWIEAFEHTALFAKLPAYVQKLHADIGDRVEADQLLAELFLPELKDELLQKEAAVGQAQAEIELAKAAIRAAEAAVATAQANLAAAEAGNLRAEADYGRWQSQYARISQLVAGGSLDRKLEDETRDSLKSAEAGRGEARAKIQSANAAVAQSRADVAKAAAGQSVAAARQKSAEADLSRVRALLQYTQIRAPFAGVVTERNVNRGDFVQPAGAAGAKPLLSVARTDQVRIFVDVPEMDAPWVEAGRTGYVTLQALPDRPIEGKVTRTSWVLGPNRTLRAELDLPNAEGALRPGMYAVARIVLEERRDVLALPLSAIVGTGQQASCWIVKSGQAARVPISLGLQVGNEAEVTAGLSGDDLVIQSQSASLQEGQTVEVE